MSSDDIDDINESPLTVRGKRRKGKISPEQLARLRGMAWKKGQSGNPGGRPKDDAALKEQMRTIGPEAIEMLATKMRSSKNEMVQLKAALAFIDIFVPKALAKQEIDVNHHHSLTMLVDMMNEPASPVIEAHAEDFVTVLPVVEPAKA